MTSTPMLACGSATDALNPGTVVVAAVAPAHGRQHRIVAGLQYGSAVEIFGRGHKVDELVRQQVGFNRRCGALHALESVKFAHQVEGVSPWPCQSPQC